MHYPRAYLLSLIMVMFSFLGFSQETLPVYSDYLSDNIYLVHPSAAGIGDCGKVRITAQKQWVNVAQAPSFQTLSYNGQLGDKAGGGFIIFNDGNGYHNQIGAQLTYAYHLTLGGWKFNQLSLGFSFSAVSNSFESSGFDDPYAPSLGDEVLTKRGYVNADLSMAYYYDAFYSYFTAKNLFVNDINQDDVLYEDQNLRNYLVNMGYYFGENRFIQFEPSTMIKFYEASKEVFVDFNMKVYKPLDRALVWAAVSYRKSFNSSDVSELNYVSPILGANFGRMMMSYTYTQQVGKVLVDRSGFHQITVGFNLFCRKTRASACPNPNLKMPFYY